MRISCVLTASELQDPSADLIVFPERVAPEEIEKAQATHPESIIVAAISEDDHCRGILLSEGQNRIKYLKVGSDGYTKGIEDLDQNPVYEIGDTCIGVLICMDVDCPGFSLKVKDRIRASSAGLKILCIPAYMEDSSWFPGDKINGFEGMHVILCNQDTHPIRCKSFITDTRETKIKVQEQNEPIHVELR